MTERSQPQPEQVKELGWIQDARQRGEAIVSESERREGKLENLRKTVTADDQTEQFA